MRLAKWIFLAATSLVLVATVQAQEPLYAPTIETWRADAALWYSPEKVSEYFDSETGAQNRMQTQIKALAYGNAPERCCKTGT